MKENKIMKKTLLSILLLLITIFSYSTLLDKSNENEIFSEVITQYPLPPLNKVRLPPQLPEFWMAAPPSVIIADIKPSILSI